MRILLAEDDDCLAECLKEDLERRGHPVVTASNGKEALQALEGSQFDLAILDWKMPSPDGLEVSRRLKARRTGSMPFILVITAFDDELATQALLASGADGFLPKPIPGSLLNRQLAFIERFLAEERGRGLTIQEQRRAETNRQFQLLETLSGGMAHDLAQLFTIIGVNAALARDTPVSGCVGCQPLAQIEVATQRAHRLCQDLLSCAGADRGELAPLDLDELLRQMTPELRAELPSHRNLEFHAGRGSKFVDGDLNSLLRAIRHLIRNADEAMEPHDGPIVIRTERALLGSNDLTRAVGLEGASEREMIWVEVLDAGVGIDPKTMERVFDPFFSSKSAGRGLGLTAALGIARAHRGGILADSIPGQGSCFRMLLPACEPRKKVEEPQPTTAVRGTDGLIPLILVVDDEEMTRSVVVDALNRKGFRTLEAGDGVEAVAIYRAQSSEIDAVLMDLTMPRMDGAEALLCLREISSDVRVLLMSGYSPSEAAARFVGLGFAHFLPKPFKISLLLQKLNETLAVQ